MLAEGKVGEKQGKEKEEERKEMVVEEKVETRQEEKYGKTGKQDEYRRTDEMKRGNFQFGD